MAVRIELAHGQPWYTNRDVIEGRVLLELRQSTDVSRVVVALCGLSRTALVRVDDVGQKFTDADTEVATALAQEQQLFPPAGEHYGDKYKLGAGKHEWLFAFRVPGHSAVAVAHHDTNFGLGQQAPGARALLPPSLSDIDEHTASIRYGLRAEASRGAVLGLKPATLSAWEPIVVLPSDPPLDHIPTFGVMHAAQSRVIASKRSVAGLLSRLVSTLAHDRVPVCTNTVYFELRCELLLTPGLKFSWLLEARVLKPDEEVHITGIEVVLVARTHVRAKNLNKVVDARTVLLRRTGLDLTFGAAADVTALLGNPLLRVPESVPPSFAFSNIMREYRLDTTVKYGHLPSSALAHKATLSRRVWVRAGMYALPSYDTGEILRADRAFPQAPSYSKRA